MIDGGPLRVSRPTSRQAAYRTESVRHQPNEPEPTEPSRMPQQRQVEPEYREPRAPRNLGWLKWVVMALVVAVICVAGWLFWSNERGIEQTIDTSKYQAVFLSNGQVYFGKLSIVNDDYMQLSSVFYLERQLTANTETDAESEEQAVGDNNFQLLKYSDVLYGSEDAMILSANDVIRYENLRPDGVVARAIADRR